MDFRSIISTAQQNVSSSGAKGKNFYSTKFEPPKKVTKEKKLSAGIQKFLEQKQKEDEDKAEQARRRKMELVSKRDPKVQRKIEKSLKTIKSSRKFHTADRSMDENEAISLQNLQPDEDDYGYTSNISDEIHRKLMEKYNSLPEEKKFSSGSGKHKAMTKEEIQRTKDRVKNALTTHDDDQHIRQGPHHRTSKIKSAKEVHKPLAAPEKKPDKPKPIFRPAPIVDFQQLLKLAEQKQHEDITIEITAKKEPERLLTSKEKREQEELDAMKRARMKPNKIPKLGAIPKVGESLKHDRNNNDKKFAVPAAKPNLTQKIPDRMKKPITNESRLRDALQKNGTAPPRPSTSTSSNHKVPIASSSLQAGSSSGKAQGKSIANGKPSPAIKPRPSTSSKEPEKPRDFPPKDLMRSREFPPRDLMRGREFPPKDLMRSREFPPRDPKRLKQQPLQVSNKRRIEDEDSEYDSELDDFIDDGEETLDYSSEIKKIFGYDKSRYRDEDFDDSVMESDYRTVMREEFVSKKIGLMEDLEDMKMEQEEIAKKKATKKARRL